MRRAGKIGLALLLGVLLLGGVAAFKVVRGGSHVWLPDYVRHALRPAPPSDGARHVIFLFADHYEPGKGPEGARRSREWLARYRTLADRHQDSYGRKPQHTWFYAYDERNAEVMNDLAAVVRDGYGEVELHWHHHDTNATFRQRLSEAVGWMNSFGAMVSEDGKVAFGFVHGKWALDNSGREEHCGVSRELMFLQEAGCYADFTFPNPSHPGQPRRVNALYRALDDDGNKSHADGVLAEVGRTRDPRAFLMFQGPLVVRWSWPRRDYATVEEPYEPSTERTDGWVEAGVGVRGRPEWIFVKVYTHGIQGHRVVFGESTDRMFSHLETRFGREPYRLHYVTAREAYNIARAAEDGKTGDPGQYRDYEIAPPRNRTRP